MNRKRKWAFLSAILCIALLSGCGTAQAPDDMTESSSAADETMDQETSAEEPLTEEPMTDESPAGETPTDESPTEETLTGDSPAEEIPTNESQAEKALSDDELQFFTDFIRKMENYGFLLSEYDTPEEVDLNEVFYSGAGLAEEISEEEIPAYLAAVGQEELYGDCIRLSSSSIDMFLQNKLGISLADTAMPFDWTYLPEFDSYYHEAGDTNYLPFSCTGGSRSGDTYTLYVTPDADWITYTGVCETVIVKTEDGYRFLSNHGSFAP